MHPLPREFYSRDTLTVARDLLGRRLVRTLPGGEVLVCRITETEAYIGAIDRACHAYPDKRTPRTETLYARPGTAYVYLIYGMYHCLNLVTQAEGTAAAVLIRGAVIEANADIIANHRFGRKGTQLTNAQKKHLLDGPGKLCQGLSVTRAENGLDLTAGTGLYAADGAPPRTIYTGPRIGIDYAGEAAAYPWRFWTEELHDLF